MPGPMREAKSYSIVDHELLRGGYLARLSHRALALYLFLVVVGDREGRSFYREASICAILRQDAGELDRARAELLREGLISFRRPSWWVRTLTKREPPSAAPPPRPQIAAPREPLPDPAPMSRAVPEGLRALLRCLEETP